MGVKIKRNKNTVGFQNNLPAMLKVKTCLEMEISLMEKFNIRVNLIVPNVSWGMGLHECDLLILRKSGIATEIEIKVSKADIKKDKTKKHDHTHKLIKNLYFAVPEHLKDFALEHIPEKAGLITVSKYEGRIYCTHTKKTKADDRYVVETVRPCIPNKNSIKWTDDQKSKLQRLAAMRVLTLKKNVFKLKQTK